MSSKQESQTVDLDFILATFTDFVTDVETACVEFKRKVGVSRAVGIREEPFLALVGWSKSQGGRIGEFEYTTLKATNSDGFNHCFNVLKANNVNISNHFGEKSWRYHYWLWLEGQPDTIYRKQHAPEKSIV